MAAEREVDSVLVIVAHPDDADFGCAGSAARWADQGAEVTYCVATDGQAGGFDLAVSRPEMARLRRLEQQEAARTLGVKEVIFLGYQDGELTPSLQLRRDLCRVIRQKRPQRVLCQSPVRILESVFSSHPDHIAAGEAAFCAVYPESRNPFAFPDLLEKESLEPFSVPEIYVMMAEDPGSTNVAVDITGTIDRKLEALSCHKTQFPDWEVTAGWVRWRAQELGEKHFGAGHFAETFKVIKTVIP